MDHFLSCARTAALQSGPGETRRNSFAGLVPFSRRFFEPMSECWAKGDGKTNDALLSQTVDEPRPGRTARLVRRGGIVARWSVNLGSTPDNDASNDAWLSQTAGGAKNHTANGPWGAGGVIWVICRRCWCRKKARNFASFYPSLRGVCDVAIHLAVFCAQENMAAVV